jgi:glycosyltransferase involved in cell wall biosynthesis
LAARLGLERRVRFSGFVADVRASIASADAALSSARTEGLGIALLEAMSMERTVVALPTGGVPEIVADGETGWLAHGRSPEALARVMQDACDRRDEVRRRSVRARLRVEACFAVEAMRDAYERVYAQVEGVTPS